LLARVLAFFDAADLNPEGKVSFPNIVPFIVRRFSFIGFPSKPEDFDTSKGIAFKGGYFEGQAIEEFTLYGDGIKLDLTSSTEQAQALALNTLEWLKNEFGVNFSRQMIRRWGFLSQLTFSSDIDLNGIHPTLGVLSDAISTQVNARTGIDLQYKAVGITLSFDRVGGEIPIANFVIERRAKTPFSEGRYYSQAPLETQAHIKLLEEFEDGLKKSL